MILQKLINSLNKTNDFIKNDKSLSKTYDFIKMINLFNKTIDFTKKGKFLLVKLMNS